MVQVLYHIYEQLCIHIGFPIYLRSQFGWNTRNYANNVDAFHNNLWFIAHSNLSHLQNGSWANFIADDYSTITKIHTNTASDPDANHRITFVKVPCTHNPHKLEFLSGCIKSSFCIPQVLQIFQLLCINLSRSQ